MRTVHEQYAPLLEGTVELIVKCFAAVHYGKLLDSAAQVHITVIPYKVKCMGGHHGVSSFEINFFFFDDEYL